MKKITVVLIGLAVFGMIAGCRSSSVNTVSNAGVKGKITRINDLRVETDSSLAEKLILTDLRETKTNDGYIRIQAFFKNNTDKTYKFAYVFNWYNNQGEDVRNPDNEAWVRKVVIAGDDVTLTSIAPTKDCGDFKLRLKKVK